MRYAIYLFLLIIVCGYSECLLQSCRNGAEEGSGGGEQPPIDPCEGKNFGYLVQNPKNCAQYIVCGLDIIQNCPKGLYFDTRRQTCDHALNVPCDIK